MSGLPAYFVNKRMFACIHGEGVGVRLPAATAANLQFSNQNVFPFQPKGMPSTREWVQLNHENPPTTRATWTYSLLLSSS